MNVQAAKSGRQARERPARTVRARGGASAQWHPIRTVQVVLAEVVWRGRETHLRSSDRTQRLNQSARWTVVASSRQEVKPREAVREAKRWRRSADVPPRTRRAQVQRAVVRRQAGRRVR